MIYAVLAGNRVQIYEVCANLGSVCVLGCVPVCVLACVSVCVPFAFGCHFDLKSQDLTFLTRLVNLCVQISDSANFPTLDKLFVYLDPAWTLSATIPPFCSHLVRSPQPIHPLVSNKNDKTFSHVLGPRFLVCISNRRVGRSRRWRWGHSRFRVAWMTWNRRDRTPLIYVHARIPLILFIN